MILLKDTERTEYIESSRVWKNMKLPVRCSPGQSEDWLLELNSLAVENELGK